jgi:hypothetical protein
MPETEHGREYAGDASLSNRAVFHLILLNLILCFNATTNFFIKFSNKILRPDCNAANWSDQFCLAKQKYLARKNR